MKKLFTTAAILGAAFAANAQKTVDLQVSEFFPVSDAKYANLSVGDTMYVFWSITNNGPDKVDAGDTVISVVDLGILGNPGISISNVYDKGLEVGQSDTLGYYFIQGQVLGTLSDGTEVIANVPTDAVVEESPIYVYGYTADALFTDAGVTVDDEGNGSVDGNNIVMLSNITFGTPGEDETPGTSIANNKNVKTIAVYPNPTNGNLNFAYTFDKASNATVVVYNVAGQVVLSKDFGMQAAGENQFVIATEALANGTYTLEFINGNNKGVSKFTVAK